MSHFQFKRYPFQFIFLMYVVFIGLFAILYQLPISQQTDISWLDSFFLSTSAISVTGLSTLSITEDLTKWGQVILFIEIQFGGIGIMTILGSFLLFFKGNVSLPYQTLMSFDQNQRGLHSVGKLMLFIFLLTVVVELIGFLVFLPFVLPHYDSLTDGLFATLFHVGASFTNAGFSLFDGQLTEFAVHTPFILLTCVFIFLGVIGFPVLLELLTFKKGKKRLSLYTKVNLKTHFFLLIGGFIIFFSVDFRWLTGDFTVIDQLSNALFLSFTSRSAGLSTIDLSILSFPVLLTIMVLMFIGGSPSSCGGGVRTTTFAVVLMKMLSVIRGRTDVQIGKKSLYDEDVNKALFVVFSFFGLFLVSLFTLSMAEGTGSMKLAFDIMSALTTTGLSLGDISTLSTFSQIWLIGLMIIGRLGIIVLIYSFLDTKPQTVKYAKEHLIVG